MTRGKGVSQTGWKLVARGGGGHLTEGALLDLSIQNTLELPK